MPVFSDDSAVANLPGKDIAEVQIIAHLSSDRAAYLVQKLKKVLEDIGGAATGVRIHSSHHKEENRYECI